MEPLKVLQMLKVLFGTIKGSSDVEGSLWNIKGSSGVEGSLWNH